MSSRDPQKSDPGGLVFNKIARDGVCIVTHPSNQLPNISQATVQAIFSGRIRNWKDVPGAKKTGPIDLVTRTPASGTADAFQNIFMGLNLRVAGNASQKPSNGLVQQAVRSNPSAIAYLDFKFTGGTAISPYQGVPCNLRNAKSGQYQGTRNFWLVSRGKPTGAAAKFLRWVQGAKGQRDRRRRLGLAALTPDGDERNRIRAGDPAPRGRRPSFRHAPGPPGRAGPRARRRDRARAAAPACSSSCS